MSDTRTSLTPNERIRVAFAHFVLGIEQQHIAMLLAVNMGRVNEACRAIQLAAHDPKGTVERMESNEKTWRLDRRQRYDEQTRELFAPFAEESRETG